MSTEKPIRVGVVGLGRGQTFVRGAGRVGMELVALCDIWEQRLKTLGEELSVATYTDYDAFLSHDMDAVVLANYFHEHAPFAVKALEAGKHVMSETSACMTLAQGVALARAVEKSGRIYFFAENYPFMAYNQEMRRIFQEGRIGDFLYGEGEYVHPDPADVKLARSVGWDHWRNWIPATYYCTHSIAPVMYITDTRPVKVNGFVLPFDMNDPTLTLTVRRSDVGAAIMCRMDNGAVMKSLHGGLRGHQNYTRIHGNRGLMENQRCGNTSMLRVVREPFDKDEGEPRETIYQPDFPVHHSEATRAGHGGGDFFTNYHFAHAISTGEQPCLYVYCGLDMTLAGIQAYRSALADGAPMDVPDFRDEQVRKAYENDHWSPDPAQKAPGQPLPSVLGHVEPGEDAKKLAREVWATKGWTE